ncbi:MAG: hypothetical protein E7633_06810 [Ruminococcaceae bacterium]|nr:hypothetical protein [Oscillospiraceae bacterium]
MYYGLIILSVVMFGGCFALNDVYRKMRGSSLKISLQFSLVSSLAGLIVLLAVNNFKIEYTFFTLIIALLSALVGLGFTFCAFKALGIINLSLYSLFSMLGGMLLPFVQGIVFYDEKMSVAKVVCFVFIFVALLLTVEKSEKTKGTLYYIGIFVLNGMSGVLSKIFASSDFEKTSAAGYSVLCALCSVILSGTIIILFFRKKDETPKMNLSDTGVGALNGIVNKIANYMLVIALVHVDASVQYPMVTGGVMIVSTLICFFGKNKPSKKEILSVLLAFVGMLALFVIPV